MKRVIINSATSGEKCFAIEVIIDNHFYGYLQSNAQGRGQFWSYIGDEPKLFTKRSAAMKKSNAGYSSEIIYDGQDGHIDFVHCKDLSRSGEMMDLGMSPYSKVEFNIVQV